MRQYISAPERASRSATYIYPSRRKNYPFVMFISFILLCAVALFIGMHSDGGSAEPGNLNVLATDNVSYAGYPGNPLPPADY